DHRLTWSFTPSRNGSRSAYCAGGPVSGSQMPAPSDLVHQTTLGTGTGTLTLVAVNGKRSFNTAFGTGGSNVFDYFISHRDAAEWERGTGHLSDATTLVRDSVLASSNSGSAVNFSAGTKDITNDVPAGKQYYQGGPTLAVADGGTGDSGTGWSTWSPTVS